MKKWDVVLQRRAVKDDLIEFEDAPALQISSVPLGKLDRIVSGIVKYAVECDAAV